MKMTTQIRSGQQPSTMPSPPPSSSSSSQSHPSISTQPQEGHPTNLPFIGKVGPAGDPALAKRRARNLLRDYYGLGSASEAVSSSRSDPSVSNLGDHLQPQSSSLTAKPSQSLSIDSPGFDAHTYFNDLVGNSSVKSLLSTANGLMAEISDLESERQSLVYNHHHELVEASETIDKMKSSSQKLDGTLARLQDSLSAVAELSTTLSSEQPGQTARHTGGADSPTKKPEKAEKFDSGIHLSALLSLPPVLKGLMTAESQAAADQLWGQWEPALRSLEEAGIKGAKQIGNECREVLRNPQLQHSGS